MAEQALPEYIANSPIWHEYQLNSFVEPLEEWFRDEHSPVDSYFSDIVQNSTEMCVRQLGDVGNQPLNAIVECYDLEAALQVSA